MGSGYVGFVCEIGCCIVFSAAEFGFFADLVVASAGDDKRISLWRKNGHSMGTIPLAGTDSGDNIEVVFAFGCGICIVVYCTEI